MTSKSQFQSIPNWNDYFSYSYMPTQFTVEQAMKAQRRSRGTALLLL
jgi:hypothetical protein